MHARPSTHATERAAELTRVQGSGLIWPHLKQADVDVHDLIVEPDSGAQAGHLLARDLNVGVGMGGHCLHPHAHARMHQHSSPSFYAASRNRTASPQVPFGAMHSLGLVSASSWNVLAEERLPMRQACWKLLQLNAGGLTANASSGFQAGVT